MLKKNSFHNSKKLTETRFTSSLIAQPSTHQTKSWILTNLENPAHSTLFLSCQSKCQKKRATENEKKKKSKSNRNVSIQAPPFRTNKHY